MWPTLVTPRSCNRGQPLWTLQSGTGRSETGPPLVAFPLAFRTQMRVKRMMSEDGNGKVTVTQVPSTLFLNPTKVTDMIKEFNRQSQNTGLEQRRLGASRRALLLLRLEYGQCGQGQG